MKNFKKILITITGVACAAAICTVGSFSFMTSTSKEKIDDGTVGTLNATSNLNIETTDDSISGKNLENLNPGDVFKISLSIDNTGNKSLATRSSLYVVWNPDDFNEYSNHENSLLLYDAKLSDKEIKDDMINGLGKETLNLETSKISKFSYNNTDYVGYKLSLPEVKLNGVGKDSEIDVKENNYPESFVANDNFSEGTYSYKVGFSNFANVHTMDKDFKIISVTEGIQNRNTNNNTWSIINIDEISM